MQLNQHFSLTVSARGRVKSMNNKNAIKLSFFLEMLRYFEERIFIDMNFYTFHARKIIKQPKGKMQ